MISIVLGAGDKEMNKVKSLPSSSSQCVCNEIVNMNTCWRSSEGEASFVWPLERHSLDEWAFVRGGEEDEMEFGKLTLSLVLSDWLGSVGI